MRYILIFICIITYCLETSAQRVNFSNDDDCITLKKGDLIVNESDTAFIISKSRAAYIDMQLDKLDSIKIIYNNIVEENHKMSGVIKDAQSLLLKLQHSLEADSTYIDNTLSVIIDKLAGNLSDLKENNQLLRSRNEELQNSVNQLSQTVKELKKHSRESTLKGVWQKLISLGIGIGLGILIVSI